MAEILLRLVLAGMLVGSSVAKLANPGSSRLALQTYGISSPSTRWVAWVGLIATELGLAAGVAAGADSAAYAAAAVMGVFAATLVSAMLRGRTGAPCGCFGSRSTVSAFAVARNLALAVGFALLPSLPRSTPSTEEWLIAGVAVALLGCLALSVAVLALARELGLLRMRLGPDAALEIDGEGPKLGVPVPVADWFDFGPRAELGVAVFLSESCHVCKGLRPAIDSLETEPVVAVRRFEESADSAVWELMGIPGSPYVAVFDRDGLVLSKGTFNNLAQLEGVVGTAERRRAEPSFPGELTVG